MSQPNDIDSYILQFPLDVQDILQRIRMTVRKAAPGSEEAIKYQRPTIILDGNLVHFGAFKHHIGFYPTPSGIDAFKDELSNYKKAKGSIQFPLDEPIPYTLIAKIVRSRVKENRRKSERKKK